MWKRFWLFAMLVIGLVGCATAPKGPPPPPEPYTRIAKPDSNVVQLQIAVRKFVPEHGRGPTILLAGCSHIGDSNYYATLQKLLDKQTLVLFEGVNADAHPRRVTKPGSKPAPRPPPRPEPDDTNAPFSMQSALAKSLGLVFQLEAIDYDRTNFLNSDLSIYQIERLMSGETNVLDDHEPVIVHERTARISEPARAAHTNAVTAVATNDNDDEGSNSTFNSLMQAMDGSSFLGSMIKGVIAMIGSSPSLQAVTRFTFVETIGNLKGDMTGMQGMPPDMKKLMTILIESRNQNVIEDIKFEMPNVPRSGSIVVFYGTGHMDDMQRRVEKQLHYKPVDDIWLTAFSADLRETGLPKSMIEFIRSSIRLQLKMMEPRD